MVERIRTTLDARIAKEGGKLVERTAGYENNEDALRQECGSDTELDELQVAGGLPDTVKDHRRKQPREHGVNAGVLGGAAQFQRPADIESLVEETDGEDGESGFITTR